VVTRSTDGRNPAWCGDFRQEKGPGDYPNPSIWWSRGDLNPRPPVRRYRFYMLSHLYLVNSAPPEWQGAWSELYKFRYVYSKLGGDPVLSDSQIFGFTGIP